MEHAVEGRGVALDVEDGSEGGAVEQPHGHGQEAAAETTGHDGWLLNP